MKLVAVAFLVLGVLCNSTLAMAEGPIPFNALMKTAGAQPGIPPITDAKDQSTAVSTQPAHRPMTRGGKIMIGVGVVMLASGVLVIGATALAGGWVHSTKADALYATSVGLAAGGVTLIVLGTHRRSAK